jgi:4-amino-4-deoxy-L-arabinose transferase-like glycosyltransferase
VLAGIALVAFVGRVVFILTVTRHHSLYFDEYYYRAIAERIVRGQWFKGLPLLTSPNGQTAEHPPLTSLALVPASWFDGDIADHLTIALAGIGTLIVVALLVRDLAGPRAGLIAAAIVACYPNLWMADSLLMSETFAALFTAVTLLFAYRLVRSPSLGNAVAAGVACALAMLTRGELVLLIPFVVFPAIAVARGAATRQRVVLGAATTAVAALLIAPWVGFNIARFEKPVFISNGDAGVLAGSNCDLTYYGADVGYWNGFCTARAIKGDESVRAQAKRRQAIRYMRRHVTRLPVVVAARVGRMWGVFQPLRMAKMNRGEGRPEAVSLAGWAAFWILLAPAVWGGLQLRRRGIPIMPLVGTAAAMTLIAAVFYGHVRFRLPADVALVVLAAVGLDELVGRRLSLDSRV